MSKSDAAAIAAVNKMLAGTSIAPLSVPAASNGKTKPAAKRAAKKPATAKVDAPYGFKADGTPRKKPVPTWLHGDKKVDSKSTTKKETTVKKPTIKTRSTEREQDSTTATFAVAKLPKGNGGVRFSEIADNGRSDFYVTQDDFRAMGSPDKIRVTIKAL